MKKIAFILVATLLITSFVSCSDSTGDTRDTSPDYFTFKVDGVQKTFTNVQVTESTYIEGDLNIPTYNVLATPQEDNGEYVAFQIERDFTGNGGLYEFIYTNTDDTYRISDNFTFSLSTNTTNKLSGTFSGPLFDASGAITPAVIITEGVFDINY